MKNSSDEKENFFDEREKNSQEENFSSGRNKAFADAFDLDEEEAEEQMMSGALNKIFPKKNSLGYDNFDSNGNFPLSEKERSEMLKLLEKKYEEIFDILRIDRNDPNSADTPHRLARMWVNELFAGRFEAPPKITVFPNRKNVDELVISHGIEIMSVCSHHWQPISGYCAIGYMPGDYVIGLSKLSRTAQWFARRGQIQEELGEQIADYIEKLIQPKALGVVIKSKHYCMIARGVRGSEERSEMITSVMRGRLGVDLNLRNEFLKLIEK